eukprot:2740125-Prymnesium_polylepis.2
MGRMLRQRGSLLRGSSSALIVAPRRGREGVGARNIAPHRVATASRSIVRRIRQGGFDGWPMCVAGESVDSEWTGTVGSGRFDRVATAEGAGLGVFNIRKLD